jgi:hypothetical protein
MPDVTATGPLSLPFASLAGLLAECATFRTWTGTANKAAALAKIDYPDRNVDANGWPLPGAIITDDDALEQFSERVGTAGGQLLVGFSGNVSGTYYTDRDTYDRTNDLADWRNTLGAILNEMLAKSRTMNEEATAGHIHLSRWTKLVTPDWIDPADTGLEVPIRYAAFVFDWVGRSP